MWPQGWGHVLLLLLGLSSEASYLDGRLGCGILLSMISLNAAISVPFQQHERRQPLRSPVPCWTFAAVTWSFPSGGLPKAMARLLDIAILTGNQKATVNLAKKCQVRPLRRWAIDSASEWEAARTALWAGADFQDLMVKNSGEDIPFPQALFLRSKLEDWQEIRHLLPKCHDLWRPTNVDNWLGLFFEESPHGPGGGKKLSLDKIRAAANAGLDLQHLFVKLWWMLADATLLDMAIWCGQPDCAEACVDGGIELNGDDRTLAWHKRVLRGESRSLHVPPLT